MFDLSQFVSQLIKPQRDRTLIDLAADALNIQSPWVEVASRTLGSDQGNGWLDWLLGLVIPSATVPVASSLINLAGSWLGSTLSGTSTDATSTNINTNPNTNPNTKPNTDFGNLFDTWINPDEQQSLRAIVDDFTREVRSATDSTPSSLGDVITDSRSFGGSNGGYFDLTFSTDVAVLEPAWSQDYPNGVRALDGDDALIGSSIGDFVFGNRGADNLAGLDGDDTLWGGKDNDVLSGGNGNDQLNGNWGEDLVLGNEGNDTLNGGKEDDLLDGGAGNDRLSGDFGRDLLTGGGGSDTFVLRSDTNQGLVDPLQGDVVTDFDPAEGDRIVIMGDFARTDLVVEAIALTETNGKAIGTAATDAIIRRISTNEVLGIVADTAPTSVLDALTMNS